MGVIKGPWPDPPPTPQRNHPAGRRRGRRSYCEACGRMFDPMRVVPDDLLCRDCRAMLPPPDPTLFDIADDTTRR